MGAPKGKKSNNPAGRKPGTINKISKGLRETITEFLENNFDEVVKEWTKLEGRDKLKFYTDLLKYSVPTLQSTELKTDLDRLTDEQVDHIIEELRRTASTPYNELKKA